MSANPSTRWFWNDWDNDQGLKLCTLAAQGLWMRMLSICARAGGYLKIQDELCTPRVLAAIVGRPPSEVVRLIAELEKHHVFSRNRAGIIFNRRMIRDAKTREVNTKNGKMGGNPSLRKQITNPAVVNRHDKPPVKGEGSPLNSLTLNSKNLPPTPAEQGSSDPSDAVGKGRRANGTNPRANGDNPRANGSNPRANGTNPRVQRSEYDGMQPAEPWPQRISAFAKSGFWNPHWGPKPTDPACYAPKPALAKAGYG